MNKNKFYMDTTNKYFKSITKNAFDSDGNVLDIKTQIFNMKNNPSNFGYGVIDFKDSIIFANINSDKIIFLNSDIRHINRKHFSDDDISRILTDVNQKIIFANDYWDSRNKQQRKGIVIDDEGDLILLSLKQEENTNIHINELATLYRKGTYEAFNICDYFYKVLYYSPKNNKEIKNRIYKNEKSNSSLSRFVFNQLGSVNNSIAELIITHELNVISRDDIKELTKDVDT